MAKEENDLMDVKIQSILRKYQEQVSELTFQSYIKDEQINNLQTKIKELESAKKIDAKK